MLYIQYLFYLSPRSLKVVWINYETVKVNTMDGNNMRNLKLVSVVLTMIVI